MASPESTFKALEALHTMIASRQQEHTDVFYQETYLMGKEVPTDVEEAFLAHYHREQKLGIVLLTQYYAVQNVIESGLDAARMSLEIALEDQQTYAQQLEDFKQALRKDFGDDVDDDNEFNSGVQTYEQALRIFDTSVEAWCDTLLVQYGDYCTMYATTNALVADLSPVPTEE